MPKDHGVCMALTKEQARIGFDEGLCYTAVQKGQKRKRLNTKT